MIGEQDLLQKKKIIITKKKLNTRTHTHTKKKTFRASRGRRSPHAGGEAQSDGVSGQQVSSVACVDDNLGCEKPISHESVADR